MKGLLFFARSALLVVSCQMKNFLIQTKTEGNCIKYNMFLKVFVTKNVGLGAGNDYNGDISREELKISKATQTVLLKKHLLGPVHPEAHQNTLCHSLTYQLRTNRLIINHVRCI